MSAAVAGPCGGDARDARVGRGDRPVHGVRPGGRAEEPAARGLDAARGVALRRGVEERARCVAAEILDQARPGIARLGRVGVGGDDHAGGCLVGPAGLGLPKPA